MDAKACNGRKHVAKSHDLCMLSPTEQAATFTKSACISRRKCEAKGSSHAVLFVGCSSETCPPEEKVNAAGENQMTFLHFKGICRAKARYAIQGSGVRSALGPLGRSLARVYSRQGGAACAKATDLLARRWSKKASSRKSMRESRRGSMARVETPRRCSAVESGAPAPAQTSRKKGAHCARMASPNAKTEEGEGIEVSKNAFEELVPAEAIPWGWSAGAEPGNCLCAEKSKLDSEGKVGACELSLWGTKSKAGKTAAQGSGFKTTSLVSAAAKMSGTGRWA